MTWFQNSAEHEVQYARTHAMITDVIEASLELGWKGWEVISNVQAAHVAKTVNPSIDSMARGCSRIGGGECGAPSQTIKCRRLMTMNSRPLEMRPDNAALGKQSRRIQHSNLLRRFTKLRPVVNPIVRHHLPISSIKFILGNDVV